MERATCDANRTPGHASAGALIMMLLQLCGDVHPQPRPLHVESVNVTSLPRYWRQVMTSKADVLCLQETRLTESG